MKRTMKIVSLLAAVVVVSSLISVIPVAARRGVRYQLVDYAQVHVGPVNAPSGTIEATIRLAAYNYPTNDYDRFRLDVWGTCSRSQMRIPIYYKGCDSDPGITYYIGAPEAADNIFWITWDLEQMTFFDYPPGGWKWYITQKVNLVDTGAYFMTQAAGNFDLQIYMYPGGILGGCEYGGDLINQRYYWQVMIGDPIVQEGWILGVETKD